MNTFSISSGNVSENQNSFKEAGVMAEGVLDLYLPSLMKAKEHIQELQ